MDKTNEQLILTALEVIADSANESEGDMLSALSKRDVEDATAQTLVTLVPLAFGRVLIAHIANIEMSSEFDVMVDGSVVTRTLNSEPIFVEALRLAAAMYHSGPQELFEPAATFSAELGAVNKALSAGEDLNRASLRRPVFWGFDATGWGH